MDKPVMPPTYLFGSLVAMGLLHFAPPGQRIIPPAWRCVGLLPLLLGIAGNVWASHAFDRAKTTVKPFQTSQRLLTGGLYRFSRHPMYLGMLLVLIGAALVLGSPAPWLVVPVFGWLVSRRFIEPEERAMEETFGDAYRQYKSRVRRWL